MGGLSRAGHYMKFLKKSLPGRLRQGLYLLHREAEELVTDDMALMWEVYKDVKTSTYEGCVC